MQIFLTDGMENQMSQFALYLAMNAKGCHPKVYTISNSLSGCMCDKRYSCGCFNNQSHSFICPLFDSKYIHNHYHYLDVRIVADGSISVVWAIWKKRI